VHGTGTLSYLRCVGLVLAAGLVSASACAADPPADGGSTNGPAERAAAVAWHVTPVMKGLDIPWDVEFLPRGGMLVTERTRKRLLLRTPAGHVRTLLDGPDFIWESGETGLMSLAVDPRFGKNRRIYACYGATTAGGGHDVRVAAWRLNHARTHVRRIETLVTGMPSTSGRHGGCRLKISAAGALFIGTGDAATGTNPQDLTSLGGKVLRVNRFTGKGMPGNPFAQATNANTRRIYTYGHRNVQGLAWRPGDTMWSVEHGPDRDDEVNRLVPGGNYGWNPVPGYNESVPMTDLAEFPHAIVAKWSSGFPTVATSGAAWLSDPRWKSLRGVLAVAALKDSALRLMRFNDANRLVSVRLPAALDGPYGRLRSVTQGPDGALYITTANGSTDMVLRAVAVF
jgi:aldose sugar dehydrogenase